MTEWTDSGRLLQRDGVRVKSSYTSIGLDPRDWQTIIIVWSQWTGRKRCGKHGVKVNRLIFTQGFLEVNKLILNNILNLTGNQWREWSLGLQVTPSPCGPFMLYTLEALWGQCQQYHTKVNCTNWDVWTREQLQVICIIQNKVTAIMPQIPYMLKAQATDCWYMWAKDDIFIKIYSKLSSRFSRVSFDPEQLNRKHREVFGPLSFVPNKEEIGYIWVHFQFFRRHPWIHIGQTWVQTIQCFSRVPDARKTYSWLSSA